MVKCAQSVPKTRWNSQIIVYNLVNAQSKAHVHGSKGDIWYCPPCPKTWGGPCPPGIDTHGRVDMESGEHYVWPLCTAIHSVNNAQDAYIMGIVSLHLYRRMEVTYSVWKKSPVTCFKHWNWKSMAICGWKEAWIQICLMISAHTFKVCTIHALYALPFCCHFLSKSFSRHSFSYACVNISEYALVVMVHCKHGFPRASIDRICSGYVKSYQDRYIFHQIFDDGWWWYGLN